LAKTFAGFYSCDFLLDLPAGKRPCLGDEQRARELYLNLKFTTIAKLPRNKGIYQNCECAFIGDLSRRIAGNTVGGKYRALAHNGLHI
jgi:hypothetical protein